MVYEFVVSTSAIDEVHPQSLPSGIVAADVRCTCCTIPGKQQARHQVMPRLASQQHNTKRSPKKH